MGLTFIQQWANDAANTFNIWSQVFAGQTDRLIRVASSQGGNSWISTHLLADLNGDYDALAIAPYMSTNPDQLATFSATTTADQVIDSVLSVSLPRALQEVDNNLAVAQQYSAALGRTIPLISYEAGSELMGGTAPYAQAFFDADASTRMYDVYMQYINDLTQHGLSMFMNFTYTGADRVWAYGNMGALYAQDEPTHDAPKYQAMMNYMAGQTSPASVEAYSSGNGQAGMPGGTLANPLVVQVTDSYGNPISGITVNWTAGTGGGIVSAPSSVTDSNGLASMNAMLGTVAGVDTFEATVTGLNPVTFQVTANPGAPASIIALAGNGQSVLVNSGFGTNLAVIVTDQYGNPVPNVTVIFAAPAAGPGGTFSGSTNVTTDSNGLATAPVLTANLLAGAYTVNASTSGVTLPAMFSLTNLSPLGISANAIYVQNIYGLLLNRVADPGAQAWVNALTNGTAPSAVVQSVEGSTEYLNDVVTNLYLHYLKRTAESAGLAAWTSALAGGASIEQVTADILGSPEYLNDQGGTNLGFVQGLYQEVLGRAGSSGECSGWAGLLDGGEPRSQVALGFLTSTEYRTDLVAGGPSPTYPYSPNWGGYYPEFLLRPAELAGLAGWVQALQNGMSDQAVLAAILGSAEGYEKW